MAAVFDGRQCPHMTAVDSGSDTYAVIVSSGDITDADAQKVWDEAMTSDDDHDRICAGVHGWPIIGRATGGVKQSGVVTGRKELIRAIDALGVGVRDGALTARSKVW